MYRLVLYYLIFLVLVATILSFFGFLPFTPFQLISSVVFLVAVGVATNEIFAKIWKVPANSESIYISALILSLIITPFRIPGDLVFLFWAAVWASASKFIFNIKHRHIFNPAALAVFLTSVFLGMFASWWVGTGSMSPFVLIGGLLVVRKLRRFDLVISFFVAAITSILAFNIFQLGNLSAIFKQLLIDSPLLFFAFVMLTEPLTTPPNKLDRVIYGGLAGILFSPQVQIGGFYTTPEIALLISNLFSYLVSPKQRLILKLKKKIPLSSDIYNFIFSPSEILAFKPGQYMEWTLGGYKSDLRGNRRYFTLASSPTEPDLILGIKLSSKSSSFKNRLINMPEGEEIIAGQLSGEFTMPEDKNKKLAFIAGGIGVTPFRSMIKYLMDKKERRDIILMYSARNISDLVYKDLFDSAQKSIGMKPIYTLTDTSQIPQNWSGMIGTLNESAIQEKIPDFKSRIFYLSGPRSMVIHFEQVLNKLGLPKNQIKTDYFPGFA